MAIVTRYFSTASAGAGDGTTWADRAALFSAGNWSTVITGFAFNGADSLNCLIGTGSYTCSQSLAAGLFANPPSASEVNRLFLRNCDSSGNPVDPDPGWISAQRAISTTAMPFINYTGAGSFANMLSVVWYGISAETANNDFGIGSALSVEKCYVKGTGSGAFVRPFYRCYNVKSSHAECTSNSYDALWYSDENRLGYLTNTRLQGVTGTTNNRRGVVISAFAPAFIVESCTIFGMGGVGVYVDGQSNIDLLSNSVINGCGSHGLEVNRSTTAIANAAHVSNNMITNCGGWGINQSSSVGMLASNNRLRNNTSGNFTGMGNYPTDIANETAAGTDADEYVDAASFDFRIKNTSSIVGKGYGVSDQPPTGGGSTRGYIIGG
jgi:hypothetical protein